MVHWRTKKPLSNGSSRPRLHISRPGTSIAPSVAQHRPGLARRAIQQQGEQSRFALRVGSGVIVAGCAILAASIVVTGTIGLAAMPGVLLTLAGAQIVLGGLYRVTIG